MTESNGLLILIWKMRQYDTIFYSDDKMEKLIITLPVRKQLMLWTNDFEMFSIQASVHKQYIWTKQKLSTPISQKTRHLQVATRSVNCTVWHTRSSFYGMEIYLNGEEANTTQARVNDVQNPYGLSFSSNKENTSLLLVNSA